MEKFYCREEELRKLNKRYHAGDLNALLYMAAAVLERQH